MLRASEDREPCEMTPMRGTFFGCCCASPVTATASNAPANRIDASAVSLNGRLIRAVFIMRTEAGKALFTSTTSQWLSGKCPSLVSDENTGRHPCRPEGDGGDGLHYDPRFSHTK